MSERKVNLEDIINTEASKFKESLDQAGIHLFIINCCKEVATQVLELAAENAKLVNKWYSGTTIEERLKGYEIWDDDGSEKPSFITLVDKQSILDTINLIEI